MDCHFVSFLFRNDRLLLLFLRFLLRSLTLLPRSHRVLLFFLVLFLRFNFLPFAFLGRVVLFNLSLRRVVFLLRRVQLLCRGLLNRHTLVINVLSNVTKATRRLYSHPKERSGRREAYLNLLRPNVA